MSVNKSPSKTRLMDADNGLEANIGTKADGTTKALHTITETNIVSDPSNPVYTALDPRAIDAIGRQRVSNPKTLFELSAGEGLDQARYIDSKVNGTGVVDYDAASVSARYSVSASGDYAYTQTRRRIEYNQGTSQFCLIAGRFETPTANLRQRRGYFSQSHGLFLEIDGTTKYFVKRSSLSGSPVDTRTAQSSWNVDPLDGTGPSGLTWDPTKQSSLAIDFIWNVPVIRYYIAINGAYHLCHVDTLSSDTVPFMDSGMAPLRTELEATGTISGTKRIYTTNGIVALEGNTVTLGRVRIVDTSTSTVSINTSPKVVAGIKLQDLKINGSIQPINFELNGVSGNKIAYYRVIYNPTLTGATWSNLPGLAQGLTNNPSFSGGSVIDSGYLDLGSKGKTDTAGSININSDVFCGSDIDGNPDALILVVETTSGSGSILFSGSYREFF